MFKITLAITALALTTLGLQQRRDERPTLRLKEEALRVEYTATSGETTLVVEAESEHSLGMVEVSGPGGGRIMRLAGGDRALQGFVVETKEQSPEEFFSAFREGMYDLHARTTDGRPVVGSAELFHELSRPTVVMTPREGAVNVPLNPVITWVPDPSATGYVVVLEQGDDDGLTATLPPGSSSFQVPYGILQPDTESHVEVGVIGSNGNCTLVEVAFKTL